MANDTYTAANTEPLIDRLRRAVIGRYDVYAELGSGGMASVFLALDLALDRKVAIKVMSPALANSPDNIERFKREAKVSASLNHPHIIGILAVGDDPELAYFVMKYIEGRSLDSVIKDEGAQSVPFVQSIIASAGKALHHSHTRGIIHRDVKPANFMLDQDGWLIVTDFGIAKQGESKGLTMTGSIIGTPYYMSPEQFHGKPVTPSADQYALGVVAYELLTGKQPYTGDTIAEVMRGVLFDEVPRVRAVRPDVPQVIDDCVAKMMAKKPEDRYPDLEAAVMAFGSITPTLEAEVRTQIINLAKLGAMQQPRMDVPLSPIPLQRPAQKTAVAPTAKSKTKTVRQQVVEEEDEEEIVTDEHEAPVPAPAKTRRSRAATQAPAPAPRSKSPVMLVLALILGGGAAGVWFTPSLRVKAQGMLGMAPAPTVTTPPVATIDSTPIRDSIIRAQVARELADSIARADSISRAAAAAAAAARDAQRRQTATQPPRTQTPTQSTPTRTQTAAVTTPPASSPPASQPTSSPTPSRPVGSKDGATRTAPATTPTSTPTQPTTAPVTQPTATQPPAPQPTAPAPATGPGTIRIGSRLAGAVLYLNDDVRPIGERGIQAISWPAGSVRVQIRAEKCAAWDTTFTVAAGQTHTIGWRAPRC